MRARFFSLAFLASGLILSGCDSRTGAGGTGSDGVSAGAGMENPVAVDPQAMAGLRARATAALAGVLPGAASARYVNLRSGTADAVCGAVAAGDAAPRPFVVTPDGAAVVSATPGLRLEDPDDPFPDLYMQYCASVEELSRIGEAMNSLSFAPAEASLPTNVAEIPLADDEPILAAPEAETPSPGEPREAGRDEDSFFNSVLRAPRTAGPRR